MPTREYRTPIDAPARELFTWHARPGAFERLTPPWDDVRVVARHGTIHDGDELRMQLRRGPLRLTWVARHEHYVEGRQFVDVQVRGPFRRWRHVHQCLPAEQGSVLHDALDYALPLAPLADWVAGGHVGRTLDAMFAFRHARTASDLVQHQAHRARPRLRVGVVGAGGGLGRDLAAFLSTGGHTVHGLTWVGNGVMAAVVPFDAAQRPTRVPPLDALIVPDGARSPLTHSQRAFELLAHLPTLPSTLITVAERPPRDSALLLAAEATARARGVRLVVVHRPGDDDWRTRDALVALVHEALMRPGLAGPLALDHAALGHTAFRAR